MVFVSLLYLLASVVAGYVFTIVLHKRFFSPQKPPPPRVTHSAPALLSAVGSKEEREVRKEGQVLRKDVDQQEGKTAFKAIVMKRGATRDHVANLQKLRAGRHRLDKSGLTAGSTAGAVVASLLTEEQEEKKEVLSHPVFCPPLTLPDEEQQKKMAELEKRVASVMIAYYAECHTLIRFLGARQWDVDKAETMLREAIIWRKGLEPIEKYRDLVSLSLAVQLSELMKAKDKFGRTVCYFVPRRHNANVRDVDSSLRVMVWFMDQVWRETKKTHHKKFVVLFNMRGFAMKNNDLSMIRAFLPILQNYYPEVLGRVLLVEYPWFVSGIWKVVKPLLDANTQNKVQFMKPEELSDHFDAAAIPKEIGGEFDAQEPEVDLWDPTFDVAEWRARPWEVIEEDGVYKINK